MNFSLWTSNELPMNQRHALATSNQIGEFRCRWRHKRHFMWNAHNQTIIKCRKWIWNSPKLTAYRRCWSLPFSLVLSGERLQWRLFTKAPLCQSSCALYIFEQYQLGSLAIQSLASWTHSPFLIHLWIHFSWPGKSQVWVSYCGSHRVSSVQWNEVLWK